MQLRKNNSFLLKHTSKVQSSFDALLLPKSRSPNRQLSSTADTTHFPDVLGRGPLKHQQRAFPGLSSISSSKSPSTSNLATLARHQSNPRKKQKKPALRPMGMLRTSAMSKSNTSLKLLSSNLPTAGSPDTATDDDLDCKAALSRELPGQKSYSVWPRHKDS